MFTEHELEDKRAYLEKYYGIRRENVFDVRNNHEKVEVLKYIKDKFPDLDNHHLIMIDDTVDVLTQVMDNTPFTTVHVSSFLDMK